MVAKTAEKHSNGHTRPLRTANDRLRRLRELSGQAAENIWERVKLAYEVMADQDYMQAHYQGDKDAAAEDLEKRYFKDISGLISVWQLREIFHTFPDRAVWEKERFNLKAMLALWHESLNGNKEPKAQRESVTVKQFKQLQEKYEDANYQARKQTDRASGLEEENRRLRDEIQRLKEEVALLRGRLQELEALRKPEAA